MLLAAVLICFASCQSMDIPVSPESAEMMSTEIEVLTLMEQAREGDVEAYYELSLRYRDGHGIAQSNLNAMFAYNIYCKMKGDLSRLDKVLFDENHPYYLLTSILHSPTDEHPEPELTQQMKDACPLENEVFSIMIDPSKSSSTDAVLTRLEELEAAGSEMSILLQFIIHQSRKDHAAYERTLLRGTEKYPLLHATLGEYYEGRYWATDDPECLEKALSHYNLADQAAMLTPKSAGRLYSLLNHLSTIGSIATPEAQYMERLKRTMESQPSLTATGQ